MSIQYSKNLNHLRLLFSKPKDFLSRLEGKVNTFSRDFFIDREAKAFIEHNKKVWQGWASLNSSKVILFDFHNLHLLNIIHIYFLNILAKKKNAKIISFGRKAFLSSRSAHAVYRSANVLAHLVTDLSNEQDRKADIIVEDIKKTIKTKEDVFNIHVNGMHIGIDIYETYLREFNKPTVVLDDELFAVIRHAVGLLVFWQDYVDQHEVAAVVLSHDCYVDYNALARVAYHRKIPIYFPDFFGVTRAFHPHSHTSRQKEYKFLFDQLTEEEKERGLKVAKKQLERNTSTKNVGDSKERVLRESKKLKVLICCHCFYDNPHCYGGMIFIDFYEWLKYLVGIARKTDYDWYLKTHLNPLPETVETIREIFGESSPITIIPETTRHEQLAREGIDVVLTVYGTVGREYPLLGVQVLNAAFNPHTSFDFTWTPHSFEEYEKHLLDLSRLKKNINTEEIYQYYFMHQYYFRNDDLMFDSFLQMVEDLTIQEQRSSKIYTYFLNTLNPARHEKIIEKFSQFIDSGKQYLTMKGPIDQRVPYVKEDGYLT
jgi:hypothetical protein